MKKDLCSKILMITKKVPILLHGTKNKSGIIWKFARLFVSLLRERRNQVEPRCVERWHLRDDEQFDLAAWFPSLKYRAGHVWPAFSFFDSIYFMISTSLAEG